MQASTPHRRSFVDIGRSYLHSSRHVSLLPRALLPTCTWWFVLIPHVRLLCDASRATIVRLPRVSRVTPSTVQRWASPLMPGSDRAWLCSHPSCEAARTDGVIQHGWSGAARQDVFLSLARTTTKSWCNRVSNLLVVTRKDWTTRPEEDLHLACRGVLSLHYAFNGTCCGLRSLHPSFHQLTKCVHKNV